MNRPLLDSQRVAQSYGEAGVVSHYADVLGLFDVERALFARYVSEGDAVLDLGVGAGRTTAVLLDRAGRYEANDLTREMVERFRARFPDTPIWEGDASDLSRYGDGTFDVVVFAFNGVDHLLSEDRRVALYRECVRVLRPGGRIVLSRHNARCVVVPAGLDRAASLRGKAVRLARATRSTVSLTMARAFSSVGWRGHGEVVEAHHGGMRVATTSPKVAEDELRAGGFDRVEGPFSDRHPRRFHALGTPWFYLVAYR